MLGKAIIDTFVAQGCEFFTGVPDSVLAGFCAECEQLQNPRTHVVSANEGNAIGLALGWWFARGTVPVVYMQNSGFSNALNPLLSAAHVGAYATPMVLLVGWRGMPGHKDEPQHRIKGEITAELASLCKFDTFVLKDDATAVGMIADAVSTALRNFVPTVVLVPPGFVPASKKDTPPNACLWSRTDAISALLDEVADDDALIATTGHIGRDVHGQLESRGRSPAQSFLCVGAMGHASQIAAGVAMAQPRRRVWCFDGDGAFLMHLGGAALIGGSNLPNLVHVVLNNGAHASVGGMATCAPKTNLRDVASALGYRQSYQISNLNDLKAMRSIGAGSSPSFVEVMISADQGGQLGRPPEPLRLLSSAFQSFCLDINGVAGEWRRRVS
ncbi:phosphonopyruvate decarboxylase [Neorhizobium galegae]|uniref:phosphonopyruvate decarboxylase n=1 Tax=Neorhizobium galegae TaxID=399 RepID=UPI00177E9E85|nr:phosphonopyruvate decarboxylase [Neorhizobium galegae]